MGISREEKNKRNAKWMKKDRLKNPEKHKIRMKEFYEKNKIKINKQRSEYKKNNRDKFNKIERDYNKKNPEKRRIRSLRYYYKNRDKILLKSGLIQKLDRFRANARQQSRRANIKKDICEKCGSKENLHCHHKDYNQPLNIDTLCVRCHMRLHHLKIPEVLI